MHNNNQCSGLQAVVTIWKDSFSDVIMFPAINLVSNVMISELNGGQNDIKNKQKNRNRKEKNQRYIISPVHLAFIISIRIKLTAKLVLTPVTRSLKTHLPEGLNS